MIRNKNNKKNYQSFDDWANKAKRALDDFGEEVERESEKNKKKAYASNKKKTVYRKFSDNKDVREIFPRNYEKTNDKNSDKIDKQSHEGNQSSRGSIKDPTLMEKQNDPVNPDLRKRLADKKARDRKKQKQDAYDKKAQGKIKKQAKINNKLKKKKELKKAIFYSEIIGPPLAKRKNR